MSEDGVPERRFPILVFTQTARLGGDEIRKVFCMEHLVEYLETQAPKGSQGSWRETGFIPCERCHPEWYLQPQAYRRNYLK